MNLHSLIFSGAVILGFGLTHVLPDAVEDYESFADSLNGYPLPFVLCLAAFLLVAGVERTVILALDRAKAQALEGQTQQVGGQVFDGRFPGGQAPRLGADLWWW
jgi:hypothetical protein